MLNKQDILRRVAQFGYPAYQYWVSAGAGLVLHGVKALTRDIDIGCGEALGQALIAQGKTCQRMADGTRKIQVDDKIDVFENWFVDEMIEIDGICVATLSSIRKQKVALNREKDWEDIRLIDAFMGKA